MARRLLAPCFALVAFLLLLPSAPLSAQGYPPSQRGTVAQRVAFTDISIEYGRPTARGRALFGALVPWDSIWHPGADLATQITVSRDIVLDGAPVAKGTYTAWRIARDWFVDVHSESHEEIQHTPYPGAASDLLRLDVMPDQATSVETLTYQFPMVLRDEATLRLQWGTTGIAMKIKAPYRPE